MPEQFVKMTKEGETIEVHPSVVENHKALGWKVVEEAKSENTQEEKPAKSDDGKRSPKK